MSLDALKAFAKAPAPADVCGLCAAALGEPHPHLYDATRDALECACPACALLFDGGRGRWKRVPHRAGRLAQSPIDDAAWASLSVPIGLVCFVRSSRAGKVIAWYPGPAGATRCELPFQPPALELEEDVEALLINRLDGANEAWRLSLDECFALVGLIRTQWRGFGGGPAVRAGIAEFFARLSGGARA